MRKRRVWLLLLCVVLNILLGGCCVYTTHQTARVLTPGRVAGGFEVGFGSTPGTGEHPFPFMLDVGPTVRVGIINNIDVGLRPALLSADAKYQFLRGPLDGAFDLGVSYLPLVNTGVEHDVLNRAFGLYPMVLLSLRHGSVTYSCGARFMYHERYSAWPSLWGGGGGDSTWRFFMPGVVLGLSIPGALVRFSPEISVYYCPLPGQGRRLPLAFGGGLAIQQSPER